MAQTPREMSQLVVQWEMEAGESFYEYSGLLPLCSDVLALGKELEAKGLLEDFGIEEIENEVFPEIITLVSGSKAFNSGDANEYLELLDAINEFIMRDQVEYMKFVRHYVTGEFHKAFEKEEIKYD